MNRRTFLYTGGAVVAAGGGLAGYGRFVEPNHVDYAVQSAGAGIPPFVQLSDLHLRKLTDTHSEIAAEVIRHEPRFLVITGDSVDRTGDLGLLTDFLGALPDVPKYVILGNWEYWGGVDLGAFRRVVENANGRVLVNESALHDDVALCGLDDLLGGRPDVEAAISGLSDNAFRVLLAHCPGQRDHRRLHDAGFELMLSGHTHGGQIRPLGVALVRPPGSGDYVSGWYRNDGPPMYVSRGIGTSVLPIRLGARPEVVFFNP